MKSKPDSVRLPAGVGFMTHNATAEVDSAIATMALNLYQAFL